MDAGSGTGSLSDFLSAVDAVLSVTGAVALWSAGDDAGGAGSLSGFLSVADGVLLSVTGVVVF